MRTTVELPNSLRAKLLELAARRGEKGFSRLVQEAVALYVADVEEREKAFERARSALGTLSDAEAHDLESAVADLRGRWR